MLPLVCGVTETSCHWPAYLQESMFNLSLVSGTTADILANALLTPETLHTEYSNITLYYQIYSTSTQWIHTNLHLKVHNVQDYHIIVHTPGYFSRAQLQG